MSQKNDEGRAESQTSASQHVEQMNAAGETQTSLSSSFSSSTEFIRMEELTEELNAITGSEEFNGKDPAPTPTGSAAKPPTVGERLMSIAASAARFFSAPVSIPTMPSTTTNPLGKVLPLIKISHVSAKGIEYVKIAEDSPLGVFQTSIKQLEKYSAEFVKNRREIIVHTFPPPAISFSDADEQLTGYYGALLSTIEQTIHAIGAALESMTMTAGARETVSEHTIEASVPISDDIALSLASQVVNTVGGSALRRYKFVLIRLRFVNISYATQFRNVFNGPALKSALARFILSARLPYCHFASTAPERRLRVAMLAQCARLNNAASRLAAAHGFAEPTRVKHVTNGTCIFKKIDSPYGPIGSAKIPIDAQSPLGQMRASIFTLIKYAQLHLEKRSNLLIRNVPESLDLSAISVLLRRIRWTENPTGPESQIFGMERVGRQPHPAGQLIRIIMRDEHAAEMLRTALNHRIEAAETSDEFHLLKAAGAFVHSDLSPPELAFQRRLREFCRAQNSCRDVDASDAKRYRYFYRGTTLMRVPRDENK